MSASHNDLPTQQPLMKAHPIPNTKHVDIAKDQIDPRGIHHVVVPYSQLASATNRFYDWPPDPEFSHVKYNSHVMKSNTNYCGVVPDTSNGKASTGSTAKFVTSSIMPRRSTLQGFKPLLRRSHSSDIETRSERELIRPRARTVDDLDIDDFKFKTE